MYNPVETGLPEAEGGSFRDPRGHVHIANGRVFRTISPAALDDFRMVVESGVVAKLEESGDLVPTWETDQATPNTTGDASVVVEHPCLPLISYPYEWPFQLLKRAALFHLDFHLKCLEHRVTLTDATAYNVQFVGVRPVFIDRLALKPYFEGEYWAGYRQFCEQFLNPLLLSSFHGIPIHQWYRGSIEGISARDTATLLPLKRRLSPRAWMHVTLQARLNREQTAQVSDRVIKQRPLPLPALQSMLRSFHKWISRLQPPQRPTVWADYDSTHGYTDTEQEKKAKAIARFIEGHKPTTVWDLGCNTGFYSQIALQHGTSSVIGLDLDEGALGGAFDRAQSENLTLTPLLFDAANPTPAQGWRLRERSRLAERSTPDGILALAVLHHMVLGRNIPLPEAIKWLVGQAKCGVIEAVPRTDPQVKRMMVFRDHHHEYGVEEIRQELARQATVTETVVVSESGRELLFFKR